MCKGGAKAGRKAGFRVMLKYFEIKKVFRYYIKLIDSMLLELELRFHKTIRLLKVHEECKRL